MNNTQAAPHARKGNYFINTSAFSVGEHTFSVGRTMRCERALKGGQGDAMSVLDDAGNLVTLNMPTLNKLQPAKPAPMPPGVTARVTAYEEMSEETLALRGKIEWDGCEFAVSCSGRGDAVLTHGPNQSATKRFEEALIVYLRSEGMPDAALDAPYFDVIDHFANYAATSAGLETFAEHEKRGYAQFSELTQAMDTVYNKFNPSPPVADGSHPAATHGPVVQLDPQDFQSAVVALDEAFEDHGGGSLGDDERHEALKKLLVASGPMLRCLSEIMATLAQRQDMTSLLESDTGLEAKRLLAELADIQPVLRPQHQPKAEQDEDLMP